MQRDEIDRLRAREREFVEDEATAAACSAISAVLTNVVHLELENRLTNAQAEIERLTLYEKKHSEVADREWELCKTKAELDNLQHNLLMETKSLNDRETILSQLPVQVGILYSQYMQRILTRNCGAF